MRIVGWLTFCGSIILKPVKEVGEIILKHKELPILKNYRGKFGAAFWQKFPYNDLPTTPVTKLNVGNLECLLEERKSGLTLAEIKRGATVVGNLKYGAPSHQENYLPAMCCENDVSTYENGPVLSDKIADWVEEEFVAGPFSVPPVKDFRSNPLKVIVNHGKARPVLNVSAPYGKSFNDNICECKMETVTMSSAARFGQSIIKAGRGSIMTKFDLKDAYKNVPCRISDYRLQGFKWGEKYFLETTQMFGARTAVSNFDQLGNTILALATAPCKIPRELVHRQLDDVPVVAPKSTNWCQEFTKEYENVCGKIGIGLAKECPKKDKAFKNSKNGKVLGIEFDTVNLSWKLPEEKRVEYQNEIGSCLMAREVSVKMCQKLLGKLNFICTMIPFMRTFKKPLQEFLRMLQESEMESAGITEEVRRDLYVWWAFLEDTVCGLPIPEWMEAPPLQYVCVTTDAAGWQRGAGEWLEVGMGCIGLDEEGVVCLANQEWWEMEAVECYMDTKGKRLGSKTTTLEFVGIQVPFLLYPDILQNKTVVIQVDNIGCCYAWENGYSKEDITAAVLVRCLLLLSAKMSCQVYIVHHRRESSWESKMADRLSRAKTTGSHESSLLESFEKRYLPVCFREWMRKPTEDWNLPVKLVNL